MPEGLRHSGPRPRFRQPIFEPLSDALIASRQMNPRLVMLLRELDGFLRAARQFGCERK